MACVPLMFGKACSRRAMAPATAGAEKEVPEMVQQVVPLQLVTTWSPGATT